MSTISMCNEGDNKDLGCYSFKPKYFYAFWKRFFDLLVAIIALICLSPIFLLTIFIVKITSKGPAFFSQVRVGKNGKEFKIYKFRSMYVDAEKRLCELKKAQNITDCNQLFKLEKDPRITKFGKLIRKASIDELPQLFNIIMGNMSFVGPRPALPSEVETYTEEQKRRLLVKQGLTGLWQVRGRGSTSIEYQAELDFEYIIKRGLMYDLGIILRTIPAVLSGKGAR